MGPAHLHLSGPWSPNRWLAAVLHTIHLHKHMRGVVACQTMLVCRATSCRPVAVAAQVVPRRSTLRAQLPGRLPQLTALPSRRRGTAGAVCAAARPGAGSETPGRDFASSLALMVLGGEFRIDAAGGQPELRQSSRAVLPRRPRSTAQPAPKLPGALQQKSIQTSSLLCAAALLSERVNGYGLIAQLELDHPGIQPLLLGVAALLAVAAVWPAKCVRGRLAVGCTSQRPCPVHYTSQRHSCPVHCTSQRHSCPVHCTQRLA